MSGGFVSTALKPKGYSMSVPTCHPTRKYHAKGLCRACYVTTHRHLYKRAKLGRTKRAKIYQARVDATLTKHFCTRCHMNYNPIYRTCNLHPQWCGLCHIEKCPCHSDKPRNLLEVQFKEITGI